MLVCVGVRRHEGVPLSYLANWLGTKANAPVARSVLHGPPMPVGVKAINDWTCAAAVLLSSLTGCCPTVADVRLFARHSVEEDKLLETALAEFWDVENR